MSTAHSKESLMFSHSITLSVFDHCILYIMSPTMRLWPRSPNSYSSHSTPCIPTSHSHDDSLTNLGEVKETQVTPPINIQLLQRRLGNCRTL